MSEWTQSGLNQIPALGTPMKGILKQQHLVYALWGGSAWSAAQDLTTPTAGDGQVVLASCMSTDTSCQVGGGVTAVWVHDAAGDIGLRQFQLHTATFGANDINHGWSPIQLVDPIQPSTVTDTESAVVYSSGRPLVAWVRDLQSKIAPNPMNRPKAITNPGERIVQLLWPAVTDERVVGYRIYRLDDSGSESEKGTDRNERLVPFL